MCAVLLAATAFTATFAFLDWYAVHRANRNLEDLAKPFTLIGLIGVALVFGAPDSTAGLWLIAALVLCLAGDIFLLGEGDRRFLGGLAAFLLGHLAYLASFIHVGLDSPWMIVPAVLVLAATVWVTRPLLPTVHADKGTGMTAAVTAYMGVIAVMLLAAALTGSWVLLLGATIFLVSDTLLALDRFVQQRSWARLAVIVTYHVGQALIVVGVLR